METIEDWRYFVLTNNCLVRLGYWRQLKDGGWKLLVWRYFVLTNQLSSRSFENIYSNFVPKYLVFYEMSWRG